LPDQTLEAIIIYGSMFFQGSGPSMEIAVELFGIPRARAGTAHTTAAGPALAATCIDGRELREGFIANLGAEQFGTSPETPLNEGDTLLLLSIDAGG
jgi:hypothetical protein